MIDLDLLFKIYKENFASRDPKVSPVKMGLLAVYDAGWADGHNQAIATGAQLTASQAPHRAGMEGEK